MLRVEQHIDSDSAVLLVQGHDLGDTGGGKGFVLCMSGVICPSPNPESPSKYY